MDLSPFPAFFAGFVEHIHTPVVELEICYPVSHDNPVEVNMMRDLMVEELVERIEVACSQGGDVGSVVEQAIAYGRQQARRRVAILMRQWTGNIGKAALSRALRVIDGTDLGSTDT